MNYYWELASEDGGVKTAEDIKNETEEVEDTISDIKSLRRPEQVECR